MTEGRAGSVERRGGAYRVLEVPRSYSLLQRAIGAPRVQQALAARFLAPFPGMRILDVGAGTGSLYPALGDCRYTALEPNADYVARMRHDLPTESTEVVQGTTADMASVGGEFDRIVLMALLHHLDDQTATAALAQAASMLAPGGRVVTMDNCFHDGQAFVARTLTRMDRGANVRDVAAYGRLATPSFKSVRSWLTTDLLRVQYSHVWVVAEDPR